jgi:hypothetical protein
MLLRVAHRILSGEHGRAWVVADSGLSLCLSPEARRSVACWRLKEFPTFQSGGIAVTERIVADVQAVSRACLFLLKARQMGLRRIPVARLHAFTHRLIAVRHAAGTVRVAFAIGDALPVQLRATASAHLSPAWGRNKSEREDCACNDETHHILPITFPTPAPSSVRRSPRSACRNARRS